MSTMAMVLTCVQSNQCIKAHDVHNNDDYAINRFNHVQNLSSCSQDNINLIFSNRYCIRSSYMIYSCFYLMRQCQEWGTIAAVE